MSQVLRELSGKSVGDCEASDLDFQAWSMSGSSPSVLTGPGTHRTRSVHGGLMSLELSPPRDHDVRRQRYSSVGVCLD